MENTKSKKFIETPNFIIQLKDGRKLSARMWQPTNNDFFPMR